MGFNHYEFDRDTQYGYPMGIYLSNVFLWMFLGLMITFGVAVGSWLSGVVLMVLSMGGHLITVILQLVVVVVLSGCLHKLSVSAARLCFVAYSALTGLTFSTLFYVYDLGSMVFVFLLTSVFFGAMALYGHFTKSDLSGLGPYLFGGLVGLVLYGVLSIFFYFPVMDTAMLLFGMVLFMAYTAYDIQKCKQFYFYYQHDTEMLQKATIFSALELYLDFINLFIRLLRFLGKRKD